MEDKNNRKEKKRKSTNNADGSVNTAKKPKLQKKTPKQSQSEVGGVQQSRLKAEKSTTSNGKASDPSLLKQKKKGKYKEKSSVKASLSSQKGPAQSTETSDSKADGLKKKYKNKNKKEQLKLSTKVKQSKLLSDADPKSNVRTKNSRSKKQFRKAKARKPKSSKSDEPTVNANEESIKYLQAWKNDKQKWRFQKVRQVWLLQNMFKSEKVPDEHFPLLLEYLEPLKGQAKEASLKDAQRLLDQYEADTEIGTITEKPTDEQYQRARETIQILS